MHGCYIKLQAEIARAAAAAGRSLHEITLVAVSKTQSRVQIEQAQALGLRVFGENRVQEAAAKFTPPLASCELHLIGPLQRNKAVQAVGLFQAIHSLDRLSLAEAIAAAAQKVGRCPRLFIQVNTGREAQKSGVAPENMGKLIHACRQLELPLTGLMVLPPQHEPPRAHFDLLAKLAREHGLPHLSMGMSGDFGEAIAAGATHIRIGSALFGPRPLGLDIQR